MLDIGRAGQATADGVLSKAGTDGHILYGPYRALVFGQYTFLVDYVGKETREARIHLEVVDSQADIILASQDVVQQTGVSRVELPFVVSKQTFSRQHSPRLEFRVGKSRQADILITSVRIERTD